MSGMLAISELNQFCIVVLQHGKLQNIMEKSWKIMEFRCQEFVYDLWAAVCCNLHFNPYPANELVLKMASTLYVCCIYSNALQTTLNLKNQTL